MIPFLLCLTVSLLLVAPLTATPVDISAKAVRYDTQGDEQHWGYEIGLNNTSKNTITNPMV